MFNSTGYRYILVNGWQLQINNFDEILKSSWVASNQIYMELLIQNIPCSAKLLLHCGLTEYNIYYNANHYKPYLNIGNLNPKN